MLEVDPLNGNITMDRGDYFDPQFTVVDAAGTPLDVSAASFTLTVKKSIDDAIAAAIFQLTTGASQFDMSQAAQGIVKVKGLETLTQSLSGDFQYDCQMILASLTRTIQPAARLRIRKDVTTVGTAPAPPVVGVLFPDWIALPTFLYWKDAADQKWVKFQLFNRNMQYVSESVNPPPF